MPKQRLEGVEQAICRFLDAQGDRAARLLEDLIRFPSTYGQEEGIQAHVARIFEEMGMPVQRLPFPPGLEQDPDYSFPEPPAAAPGDPRRFNIVAKWRGTGHGRSVILQAHTDVVPAAQWPDAFTPRREGMRVYGRGACDDKGSVVTMLLALQALQATGVQLAGDLFGEVVIDEEVGGNGALATILHGPRADAAVVLEATGMDVHPAGRGALWFRLTVEGRPAHMARRHDGVNAIEKMIPCIDGLLDYERRLVAESRGYRLFESYEYPVQLNLGTIHGGEWPAMVAGRCVLEGGVGFLPDRSMEQVKRELREAVESHADAWTRQHYTLEFPRLHNDAYEMSPDHPVVETLATSARDVGLSPVVRGMIASCDARLYFHRGGMPTVVFGPGDMALAHSNQEHIDVNDILSAAKALAVFVARWCGVQGASADD